MRSLQLGSLNKQPYVAIDPTYQCSENQFSFVVNQNDAIDPEKFVQREPALTYEQMKEMPYLQHLSTEAEFKKRDAKRVQGLYWNQVTEDTQD